MERLNNIKKVLPYVVCLMLLAVFIWQEVRWINYASHTGDENVHIVAGYLKVRYRDFTMGAYQPPLIEMIQALPLLALDIKVPFDHPSWLRNDWAEFTDVMIYENNSPEVIDKMFLYSRWMGVLLGVALGGVVAWWLWRSVGIWPATIGLFILFFDPNIITHAGSGRVDLGSVLFTILALYAFRCFLRKPEGSNAWFTGLAFGLAMMTRSYSLILGPVYLLAGVGTFIWDKQFVVQLKLWGGSVVRGIGKIIGIILVCFFICLLLSYRFEYRPLLDHVPKPEEKLMLVDRLVGNHPVLKSKVHYFLEKIPLPAKSYYLSWFHVGKTIFLPNYKVSYDPNVDITKHRNEAFLQTLRKSTIGLNLLTILAMGLFFLRKGKSIDEYYLFIAWAVVFSVFIIIQNTHGTHHVLLLFPLSCLMIATSLSYLDKPTHFYLWDMQRDPIVRDRWFGYLRQGLYSCVSLLLLLIALEPLQVQPNYMAFYNQLSGGPQNAYQLFNKRAPQIDFAQYSDLSWGQDFKVIKTMISGLNIPFVYVTPEYVQAMYWNFQHFMVPYEILTQVELTDHPPAGWYLIGLRRASSIPALAGKKPEKVIGYTLGLYLLP